MNQTHRQLSTRFQSLLYLVASALTIAVSGCQASTSAEDDGRLEHHVPAHKPATYRVAVEQLQLRSQRLTDETASDQSATERAELLDIIHWLPELAGDSDLRRADWEQVQRVSQELEQLIDSSVNLTELSHDKQRRYQGLLKELQSVVPGTDRFEQPAPE
jgi:hypothetical protein